MRTVSRAQRGTSATGRQLEPRRVRTEMNCHQVPNRPATCDDRREEKTFKGTFFTRDPKPLTTKILIKKFISHQNSRNEKRINNNNKRSESLLVLCVPPGRVIGLLVFLFSNPERPSALEPARLKDSALINSKVPERKKCSAEVPWTHYVHSGSECRVKETLIFWFFFQVLGQSEP